MKWGTGAPGHRGSGAPGHRGTGILRPALLRPALLLCVCASVRPCALYAQRDSVSQARTDSILAQRPRGDSIRPRPPITPGQAFLRSLVLPGWGQSSLNRNVTGGIFVAFEGVALTMVWKSGWQLDFAGVRGKYVKSHTQEQQDWVVLLIFNHLMSGAEAYVSAHLWDFPAGLEIQRLPDGSTNLGLRVPF